MKARARVLLCWAGILALAGGFVVAGSSGAGDDKSDVRDAVQKVADAIQKGDADQAKMLAGEVAKDGELEAVMYLMKKRDAKGKAKGYFGLGKTPGAIQPDGIEPKLLNISKRLTQPQVDKEAEALAEMGYRIAAIAEIAKVKPNDKAAKKKPEWAQYADAMGKAGTELAEAAKEKKALAVKAAAAKAVGACNNCHISFRDD
ncbi:MAG TPA: hypothetical protein VGY58_20515 [Gemmataceae bacterium]|nr:hypothetical protein [Gemmataceae bacterium]